MVKSNLALWASEGLVQSVESVMSHLGCLGTDGWSSLTCKHARSNFKFRIGGWRLMDLAEAVTMLVMQMIRARDLRDFQNSINEYVSK